MSVSTGVSQYKQKALFLLWSVKESKLEVTRNWEVLLEPSFLEWNKNNEDDDNNNNNNNSNNKKNA